MATRAEIQRMSTREFLERFRSFLNRGTSSAAQTAISDLSTWIGGADSTLEQRTRAEALLPTLRTAVTSGDNPIFRQEAEQSGLSTRMSRWTGMNLGTQFQGSTSTSGKTSGEGFKASDTRTREQQDSSSGFDAMLGDRRVTSSSSTSSGGGGSSSPPPSPPPGPSGGGGGGGGLGGVPTTSQEAIGVPGGYELWNVAGKQQLVYQHDSGPFVGYHIPDREMLGRIFPDGPPRAKKMTHREANRLGLVTVGTTNLLSTTLGESWQEGFDTSIERSASFYPWLQDPEVVATLLVAQLEGREVTQAELESTDWFGSRSEAEVQYAAFAARATKTELDQYNGQFINRVRDQLEASGLRKPPESITRFIAHRWSSGAWSEAKAAEQIVAISNPFSRVKVDSELGKVARNFELDTLGTATRKVKDRVVEWLGPMHGNSHSAEWYEQWAGAIADDPNAENDLIDYLQGQRLSLYPNHENAKLRYADIAPVWENEMASIWGRVPDGKQDYRVIDQLIRANDATEAGQILRRSGLDRGVEAVTQDAISKALQAFGGQVVNAE